MLYYCFYQTDVEEVKEKTKTGCHKLGNWWMATWQQLHVHTRTRHSLGPKGCKSNSCGIHTAVSKLPTKINSVRFRNEYFGIKISSFCAKNE